MRWIIWIAFCLLLTLSILLFFFREDVIFWGNRNVFLNQIGGGAPLTAGPLLDGYILTHDFILDKKIALSEDKAQKVCFNFLMANYSGTKHGSDLVFSVEVSGKTYEQTHPVETVKDNAFHRVCFDFQNQITSLQGQIRFVVKAEGSSPGQAVTFWLSPDLRQGQTRLNGKPSGGSLIASIDTEQPLPASFNWAIVSLLLCFCMMITLLLRELVESFLFQKTN